MMRMPTATESVKGRPILTGNASTSQILITAGLLIARVR